MNDESLGLEEKSGDVDILFFEIGGGLFGADASQVLRIDRSLPEDITLPELGRLHRGNRALVFDTPEGEGHLKVDAVNGVRSIPVTQLRRMPPTAGAAPYAVGVCLEEARTVLLIDLVETARTQETQGRH
ncbi:frizzy aggegation protein B [Myxococcus stipitatus DSM 14675]|uniref:Frizzy aggegation protein B n=1 Tax=Myxococcus stipitatus (strain DSM 14675 / JCM 12634 / Mx s8) TaxID=1278073 RepID=L7U878_MYXSD|nr:frizzy aggregation protein FrzB [Myxococcus stipitatus]AGC45116.1 frizzy aggegation protein B [Myxococcus stipitatus DSM 14675]